MHTTQKFVNPLYIDKPILVIGGDGLIGTGLVAFLRKIGANVLETSRREERVNSSCFYLNLGNIESFDLFDYRFSYVLFCAGISGAAICENQKTYTNLINVINTLALVKKLNAAGTRIVFISSSAVFDGNAEAPNEFSTLSPSTEYGWQKATVERELMTLMRGEGQVAIVRLSKVLSIDKGKAADFMVNINSSQSFFAFNDLFISPISLEYAVKGLISVLFSKQEGVFHFSGAEEISYFDFAKRLAIRAGADPSLVQMQSCLESGLITLFRPRHPSLGMKRTMELLGLYPEPSKELLNRLCDRNNFFSLGDDVNKKTNFSSC
jgi:dTDP-4-dehydrorhamnose reductase